MIAAKNARELGLNMVFTTAVEGGIQYWATLVTYRWSTGKAEPDAEAADFYADICDSENDNKAYRIDAKVIKRGIRKAYALCDTFGDPYQRLAISDLYAALRAHVSSIRWDEVDYDSDTADIIVQAGLFGEVVYG